MRINKFLALHSGMSRRAADAATSEGRVLVDGQTASTGQQVKLGQLIILDGKTIKPTSIIQTIMLNKPAGYVVSRQGQGGKTVYDLLPSELHHLKPVGRLDKDSSGLLLLTNDGKLAQELTHPKYQKAKIYEIGLDRPLETPDKIKIEQGIKMEDYISKLGLIKTANGWQITMAQGKNRQIRRTFAALGYEVTKLHRTHFGEYSLNGLISGAFRSV
jgi:23S rRNA pseudouridine2605 synthase